MTSCTTYRPMIGAREGELSPAETEALRAHVAGCEGCRRWAAELAATEGLVSEALLAAAARRDFAPFVDGVMARVRRREAGPLARLFAAVRLHPRIALSALVPAVAALALVVYVRVGSPGGDLAAARYLEVTGEGGATMILETRDGPVVLLTDDEETS